MKLSFLAAAFTAQFFLISSPTVAAFIPYDGFESGVLSPDKWREQEIFRGIENGRFIASQSQHGSSADSRLPFLDPDNVSTMQADVTVSELTNTGDADTRAMLRGFFYNDGTPGEGFTGEIYAEVRIGDSDSGLQAGFFIFRCTNLNCTSGDRLHADETFFGPVNLDDSHTLSLSYDSVSGDFTFGFDGATETVNGHALAPRSGPSQVAFKAIGTRVSAPNAGSGGSVTAAFDNVYVNGALYDDFSAALLDPASMVCRQFFTTSS